MATNLDDLDLPEIGPADGNWDQRFAKVLDLDGEQWLLRDPFGFSVWRYEDATAILRDRRWHSASARLPELFGVTDERFLGNQQVSILSAEGDMHTRLRRLVAPAFSPRAADRLRPFMRDVINGLVDRVAATG